MMVTPCLRQCHREEQHAKLAMSEQTFLCPACCQAHQIAELKNTFDALKLELEQLKQVVHKQSPNSVPYANTQASSNRGKESYSSMV